MKQFHEFATIKHGSITEGYFIADTHSIKDPLDTKALTSLPYMMVDADRFDQLVRRGMVQQLVWQDGKAVCSLTEEERNVLIHNKLKKDYIDSVEEHYWDRDTTFSSLHVNLADARNVLALSACSIASILGIRFMLFAAYGREDLIRAVLSNSDCFKKAGATITSRSSNHFSFAIPASTAILASFFQGLRDLAVPLTNTNAILSTLGEKNAKAGRLVKVVGDVKYLYLVEMLDKLTAGNLNSLLETASDDSNVEKAHKTTFFE